MENPHINLRHLHTTITTWVPMVKRVGHFFLEPIDHSLLQTRSVNDPHNLTLNISDLSQQLISVVNFLHTPNDKRQQVIYHCKLDIENIHLKLDNAQQRWIVKLGDFSQAKIITPQELADEETMYKIF